MKTFDFEHKDFLKTGPAHQKLLKKTYKSGMTLEDFKKIYVKLPRNNNAPKRGYRSPSMARQRYEKLQKEFNFFN